MYYPNIIKWPNVATCWPIRSERNRARAAVRPMKITDTRKSAPIDESYRDKGPIVLLV